MANKEKVNFYRALSVIIMIISTLAMSGALCYMNNMYLDEILIVLFLNIIFILTFLFEVEYERKNNRISNNSQTTCVRLAAVYFMCCAITFGMSFMPEFFRPAMVIPLLICSVSNPLLAVSCGLFCDIMLALTAGESFHALAGYVLLTMIGGVVSEALTERRFRLKLAAICFFANLMIPDMLLYLSSGESNIKAVIFGLINGALTALSATIILPWLSINASREVENRLLDITSVDYSEVKALKSFSLSEYRHAVHVSNVAFLCAKECGLDKNLCLAAGFYYRMGQWIGEPCVSNGVDKAIALCFPEPVTRILSEYYGIEKLPTTPESALVHMVDSLVTDLDKNKGIAKKAHGERELLIYHAINELSASGIYDKSNMGMNLYLKIRGFLAKEELLH